MLKVDNVVISESIDNIIFHIKDELTNGKLDKIIFKGDEIRVTCPSHKDGAENRPSCGIYIGDSSEIEYGTFHCFTCGAKGPFWKFVAECFDISEASAKKWLISRYGTSNNDFKIDLAPISLNTTKIKRTDSSKILEEYFKNTIEYHPYLESRRLSKDICNKFCVRYEPESKCVVFPVWDEKGELYMFTRRAVDSKKFIIDADKEKPVYLLNFIRKNNIKEVTICESQINALTLWSYGIPAVALFGTGTKTQYELLNKSGVRHIYLCLDGDSAGDKGIERFLKNIKEDIFVDVIMMQRGKDVNDLTESQFNSLKIKGRDEWLKEK